MLKVLWIEDVPDNIGEYTDDLFELLFGEPSIPASFEEAYNNIKKVIEYDFVIIDIDLTDFPYFNSEFTKSIKEEISFTDYGSVFAKKAGLFIFTKLLELGFPKERVIFLTANAGSEYNTYDMFKIHFNSALMVLPEYIRKDGNAPNILSKKLATKVNYYLVLRRGIIEGCDFLKKHLEKDDSNLQFRKFIRKYKDKESKRTAPRIKIETTDIENYLGTLADFLSLKEANEQNTHMQYRFFLRTLAHEWEENISEYSLEENDLRNFEDIFDIYTFAKIMKMTRNWVAHANLLEPLNPEFIAFLFLINMRAMFRLPKEIQAYERTLLNCICPPPVEEINVNTLGEDIKYAENNVNGVLKDLKISEYKQDKDGNDKLYRDKKVPKDFGGKVNDIYRQNSGNPTADKHDFKELLFQTFWVNQKDNLSNLTAPSDDFLPTLARHIYSHSFHMS